MARVAPEDKYAGLADPALLAKSFPDLDLVDRALPDGVIPTDRAVYGDEDAPRTIEVAREELPEKLTVMVVGGNGGD